MITCKQCGTIKSDDNYRPYHHNKAKRYNVCLGCEKINSRCKYLVRKEVNNTITDKEATELSTIRELYDVLDAKGLRAPKIGQGRDASMLDDVTALLELHKKDIVQAKATTESLGINLKDDQPLPLSIPEELTRWLTGPLDGYTPETLQDEVYDELCEKYRPKKYIDPVSLLPVYDDTYKPVLDKILDRFDEYETDYYQNN